MAGKSKSLKWYGKAVTAKMEQAQIVGVNQTMAAASAEAKQNHSWQNRTGTLEGSIDIADYARAEKDGVRGTWGARDIAYARIHELGGTIRPKTAKALAIPNPKKAGAVILVQSVTIPARPYLRPAADKEYPKLASRIKKGFERASKRK
ncbi:phage virion morphogenesis protein [Sinorhizobium medicae]|uniref:phage morphogenesis protein n=1 Tax=Sinorhizobium medicae TaxID=110321 RepID=UPI000FD844F1|nr:phage morphogenesis protein [Sinorhizobium medicae]RVI59102.1 phage morphogenesis protein [Sinorhizobium medicae]